jgi:hypothetical protein
MTIEEQKAQARRRLMARLDWAFEYYLIEVCVLKDADGKLVASPLHEESVAVMKGVVEEIFARKPS